MAGDLIYAFRVMRLPLLDAGGAHIGRLEDIVVIPPQLGMAPRVLGFVATSQRRRIFVNAARIGALDGDGARLRSWDVDLNPFKPQPGELLIGRDLIDRKVGDETVSDVALRPAATAARRGGRSPRCGWPDARRCAAGRATGCSTSTRCPTLFGVAGRRRDGRRGGPAARHAPQRRGRRRAGPAAAPAASSWPRRWTTSASPTCSRSCPRPSSCASSKGSTSTG